LPPAHVAVPAYWTDMARVINNLDTPGTLLVLPPDDFYQMPYKWGYYGDDLFIRDLMQRPVLVPSGESYIQSTPEVLNTVALTAKSILAGDWTSVDRLLEALNAPLVLVRGDIDTSFPGRS